MFTKKKKLAAIKKVQLHDKDTGSHDVQTSILSERIDELAKHLKKNKKDLHSRRGLIKMVADRRKKLKYLEKKDKKSYGTLVKVLGLKK